MKGIPYDINEVYLLPLAVERSPERKRGKTTVTLNHIFFSDRRSAKLILKGQKRASPDGAT